MSVKSEENGRRSVQVEIEVPGSPEEVWNAIATGPGISSWFVPTEVEGKSEGTMTSNFGMGMESTSTISEWEPPHRFVKDGDGMDPEAPPAATEWIVEAKSGGTCIVRVVHSWFASTDEWDAQWEAVENGWVAFFDILRLKLQHFPGQVGAQFDVTGVSNLSSTEAWNLLLKPLGLSGANVGDEIKSQGETPALNGEVVTAGRNGEKEMLILISEPTAGVCQVTAMPMGEQTYGSVRFYLFGDKSEEAVRDNRGAWESWFTGCFSAEG